MSKNVTGADNQQGSPLVCKLLTNYDPSETTRRAPFSRVSKREIKSYLLGALHDASLNKGKSFRFTQKHKKWLETIQVLLKKLDCKSWIYKEGRDREMYALETLAKFLDFNFNPNDCKFKSEKIGYIRGFFDAEGGIPHKEDNRFYIQFVQKDNLKLRKIKRMLSELDISSGIIHNPSKRVDPNYWRFFISTKSHIKFAKTIGSWHPIKFKIFRERMEI